jgi:hypothetical protein
VLAASSVVQPPAALAKLRRRSRKRRHSFAPRSDFAEAIPNLGKESMAVLDQLRDDLQEAVERVVRIHGAFVKSLSNVKYHFGV